MRWKYEKYKDEEYGIEQIDERKFRAWFDPKCTGCITQILVSTCRDKWCELAKSQNLGYAEVTFTVPEDVHEFYIAGDLQYSLGDAIRNYPKNIAIRVFEERIPTWVIVLPLAGAVIYWLLKGRL